MERESQRTNERERERPLAVGVVGGATHACATRLHCLSSTMFLVQVVIRIT